jgi:hypothetical protein
VSRLWADRAGRFARRLARIERMPTGPPVLAGHAPARAVAAARLLGRAVSAVGCHRTSGSRPDSPGVDQDGVLDPAAAAPDARRAYEAIKERVAAEHAGDGDYDDYTRGKRTPWVIRRPPCVSCGPGSSSSLILSA